MDVRDADACRGAAGRTSRCPKQPDSFIQAVGMFDAANGTRARRRAGVRGRAERPGGADGPKEYFVSMERYCGFVYYELIGDLLRQKGRRDQ